MKKNSFLILSILQSGTLERFFYEVEVFWEGHKIWKKSPSCFWRLLSNFKNFWDIYPNFVPFSEYINYISY